MTPDEGLLVADAVRGLYDVAELAWPPASAAPVPLDRLIAAHNLVHAEVTGLTRAAAAARLAGCGIIRPDLLRDATALAGFLFANAAGGYLLVRREDPLPRRRFLAAHELGHYLLHFLPRLRSPEDVEATLIQDDGAETIQEGDGDAAGAPALTDMERQANRFAAELLMPEELCRRLWERYAGRFGPVARFVVHHLAGDLLVSREAALWRLRGLVSVRGLVMGLEFLRDHGGCRLRRNLDQLPLPAPEPPDGEAEPADAPQANLDFELPRDGWRAIPVGDAGAAAGDVPRRFIDGSHLGQTVAWLRDAEGHPVPVRLAEIGGVCVRADGRDLRREFGLVERVVSMVIDPFPWNEVEGFAAALAERGLRLLPASPPRHGEAGRAASYNFEMMREQARVRAQHEMEVLEELALCQDPDTPSLVDGRLGRFQQPGLAEWSVVGVIKRQSADYLHPLGWQVLYDLEPGERTPAFQLPSKDLPVVSWYLKLDGARRALPNYGVVRVEVPVGHFNRNRCSSKYLNRLSWALFQLRCRRAGYGRSPVSLEPIVRAEESLKSLFSPAPVLAQRFYHLTGL